MISLCMPLGGSFGFLSLAGVDEAVMPSGVDEAVMPSSVDEAVMPSGVDEAVMPSGVDEGVMPSGVDEGVMPSGVDEAVMPSGVDEAVTNVGFCSNDFIITVMFRGFKNLNSLIIIISTCVPDLFTGIFIVGDLSLVRNSSGNSTAVFSPFVKTWTSRIGSLRL